jgi:hypothetical protein
MILICTTVSDNKGMILIGTTVSDNKGMILIRTTVSDNKGMILKVLYRNIILEIQKNKWQ